MYNKPLHKLNTFITNEVIDNVTNLTLDLDVLELLEEMESEYLGSDFNIVPIYDDQGFFYSYAN